MSERRQSLRAWVSLAISPIGSTVARLALSTVITTICFVALRASNLGSEGPWRTDETLKVTETIFLRHLLACDFAHPDWFQTGIERANPPVGKVYFGLALLAAGYELPSRAHFTWATEPPAGEEAAYRMMRAVIRNAAMVATLTTAFLSTMLAARFAGVAGAALWCAIFVRHFLTYMVAAHGIFDTLQTALAMASLLPLLAAVGAAAERRRLVLVAWAGVFAALAFQTRLNGLFVGIAGAVALATCSSLDLRQRARSAILYLLAAMAVSILVNPYYWAEPIERSGIPKALLDRPAPVRVVVRALAQVEDARAMVAQVPSMALSFPGERLRFFARKMFSGWPGLALLAGLLAALAALRWETTAAGRTAVVFALALAFLTAIWIPIDNEHYVFLPLPALAVVAAAGIAGVTRLFARIQLTREP